MTDWFVGNSGKIYKAEINKRLGSVRVWFGDIDLSLSLLVNSDTTFTNYWHAYAYQQRLLRQRKEVK